MFWLPHIATIQVAKVWVTVSTAAGTWRFFPSGSLLELIKIMEFNWVPSGKLTLPWKTPYLLDK